jgi:hypothetical protein
MFEKRTQKAERSLKFIQEPVMKKSYRLELNSRSDENLPITAGIKNAAAKLQKSFESSSSWQTHAMDFTAPDGADSGVFSVWIGKITPGKKIFVRNIKCRELQK